MARTGTARKVPEEPKAAGALFVRDAELVEAIDGWVDRLNQANPDAPRWDRAKVVRTVMKRALRERGEKGEAP